MNPMQLRMIRYGLEGLPSLEARIATLPEGYGLRTYREGDEAHWAQVINRAFGGSRTVQDARAEIMDRPPFRPERLFFATYREMPVGTACAWIAPGQTEVGFLHMVGVDPEHRGRGLGFLVCLAVLHTLRDCGIRRALLDTDDWRLPAIWTYHKLGFVPLYREPSHPERWKRVYAQLNLPLPDPIEWEPPARWNMP